MAGNRDQAVPASDDEWYNLIQPEIDVDPLDAEASDVIAVAKSHAEQVVERTNLEVNLDRITWKATWELKAIHGYCKPTFGWTHLIKLSLLSLETNGWQRLMETVRHELVHAWQFQHDDYNDDAETDFDRSHGESFERWMPILNVHKRSSKIIATWTIECPHCGSVLQRLWKRRKHQIAEWVSKNESVFCRECEEDVSEYTMRQEGERIDIDALSDVPTPTDEQRHVFLYNGGTEDGPIEWQPRTVSLRTFPGIGDAKVVELGDDIQIIEDFLTETGDALTDRVHEVVSPQYHEDLLDEVQSRYSDAVEHRSEGELDLLDQVVTEETRRWWQQIECIGGVGEIEAMCRMLRQAASVGDQVTLTLSHVEGEHSATVVDKDPVHGQQLQVSFDSSTTSIGPEATIAFATKPQAGRYPVFRDDSSDGPVDLFQETRVVQAQISD